MLFRFPATPRRIFPGGRVPSLQITAAVLLLLALWGTLYVHAQMPQQRPQGYVSDLAGVLSPAAKQRLEALATELDQKAKAQLAVVTVPSLEDRPIEEFVLDLATQWGVGNKQDRGALLFLSIQDRRSRIEVGYGLESLLPDGLAGGILRSMTPHLQGGDYDGAILLGAASIAQVIAQDAGVTLSAQPSGLAARGRRPGGGGLGGLFRLLPLFFVFPFLFRRRRYGRYGGWYGGPGMGGFHGGGGFGGGFGGFGGGGFGGGGASGRW